MNLNNLKQSWQHFKIINGLETIETEDILAIINTSEQVGYSFTIVNSFSNATILGFVLLLIQSC